MRPQHLTTYLDQNAPTAIAPIAKAVLASALEIESLFESDVTNHQELRAKASDILLSHVRHLPQVWGMLTESLDEVEMCSSEGEYVVAMHSLDGDSVVESGLAVGTMVGIYKQKKGDLLFTGRNLVAAMYVVYGNGLFCGVSFGSGLHIFKRHGYDWTPVRSFARLDQHTHIAALGGFDTMAYIEGYKDLTMKLSRDQFKLRYSGSVTADLHHLFMQGGGIFIHHGKKLKLLYECAPAAFLLAQAGGHSTNGLRNTLTLETTNPHETTIFLGGTKDVVDMAMTIL